MKYKILFAALFTIEIVLLGLFFLGDTNFQILNPKGPIAREQRDLILTAVGIMLIVAIPLLTTLYYFAYKYRAGNKKHTYKPDEKHGKFVELWWWLIPAAFIFVLAVITWNKTHALDPYRPLASRVDPIKIQVVALRWKWLFIYPEQNIATVNFVQFPEKTPVNFELTADAPMNSFWIPQLSGQIYAMTGMSTKLHVMADSVGDFPGQAAEINGRGFSGMKFVARSTTQEDFDKWVYEVRQSPHVLDSMEYSALSEPSENSPVFFYGSHEENLYNKIITKFTHSEKTPKAQNKTH